MQELKEDKESILLLDSVTKLVKLTAVGMQSNNSQECELFKGKQAIRVEVCENQVEWRTEIEICNLKVSCKLLLDQALPFLIIVPI